MKAVDFTSCICCGRGLAHAGSLTFIRIKIDYMVLNVSAIQRQHGLEKMVGNAALAAVLGPDEDLAAQISTGCGLICGTCMIDPNAATVPFSLMEKASFSQNGAAQ